jgi:hypothetical protein
MSLIICAFSFELGSTCLHVIKLMFTSTPNGIGKIAAMGHDASGLVSIVCSRYRRTVHAFVQVLAPEVDINVLKA